MLNLRYQEDVDLKIKKPTYGFFMKRTLRIIGDVLAAPSEAFSQIKQHPTCLGMFLLLSVVSTGSGWAFLPYYMSLEMLEFGMEASKMQEIAGFWLSIVFFLPPLPLLIKCVIFAGLLYLGVRFLGNTQSLTFKLMFATVVYSEFILVFAALINVVLLVCFKEVGDIQDATDYQMIPSLHLIFGNKEIGTSYFTFLSQITPFSIWYVYVLSRGVAIIGDLSQRTATWLVTLIWLAGVGVQGAITVLDTL